MAKKKNNKVATVFGGGVSAMTSALVLGLLGFDTKCIAQAFAHENREKQRGENPYFASLHGVASILTHSVKSPQVNKWLLASLECFQRLSDHPIYGVGKRKHFEVFETELDTPSYVNRLHNPNTFGPIAPPDCPRRSGVEDLWGWSFDCLFVHPESYFSCLHQLLTSELNTSFQKKDVTRENWKKLSSEIVIDCMEAGSVEVFDDHSPAEFLRGIMVYVDTDTVYSKRTRGTFSYNYVPATDVYSYKGSGKPSDLFFYPRMDSLILGVTREQGYFTRSGLWSGERMDCEHIEMNGILVPRPIIDVNADIIRNGTGVDILKCPMHAVQGIRCGRRDGVRLELEKIDGHTVVHNTFHGGAGITLSYGTAIDVARKVIAEHGKPKSLPRFKNRLLQSLQKKIIAQLEEQ